MFLYGACHYRRREEEQTGAAPAVDIVTELYDLLGQEVVLLPVRKRKKAPTTKGWQQTKLEDTQPAEYRAHLLEGNIGVLLVYGFSINVTFTPSAERPFSQGFELRELRSTTLVIPG